MPRLNLLALVALALSTAAPAQELTTQPVEGEAARPSPAESPLLLRDLPTGTTFRVAQPLYIAEGNHSYFIEFQNGLPLSEDGEREGTTCRFYSPGSYYKSFTARQIELMHTGLNGLFLDYEGEHGESNADDGQHIFLTLLNRKEPLEVTLSCSTGTEEGVTLDDLRQAFGPFLEVTLPEAAAAPTP